ncbi:MAG TPA: acyl carrier protein [Anaerolineales bacterium]|nr:acyl carrier protein [Anaerolineales bacterium]
MASHDDIKTTVKGFILAEFLPGEDPNLFQDSTPLVSGGILDSLATLRLVSFLQEQFGVEIEPHEMTTEHLDTLTAITDLVEAKL